MWVCLIEELKSTNLFDEEALLGSVVCVVSSGESVHLSDERRKAQSFHVFRQP